MNPKIFDCKELEKKGIAFRRVIQVESRIGRGRYFLQNDLCTMTLNIFFIRPLWENYRCIFKRKVSALASFQYFKWCTFFNLTLIYQFLLDLY